MSEITNTLSCKCIKVIYSIDEEDITIEVKALPILYNNNFVYSLPIEGIEGGAYLYFDNNYWRFGNNIFTLNSTINCPYGTYIADNESNIDSFRVVANCSCPDIPAISEEENCFKLLVWQKQCEFSKCVLNYLQQLELGMTDCCELFEDLENKKRILKILNCYDTRDIPANTTEYNTIPYIQIKRLLGC